MNLLLLTIFVPVIAGLVCLVLRRLAPWLALITAAIIFAFAAKIFMTEEILSPLLVLRAYSLSSAIFAAAALLTLLIVIFSLK
jgi:hypothetical protein